MASITVRNIPADVYEDLKEAARANRRSVNSEILVIIEDAVRSKRVAPEEFLVRARLLREKTAGYTISDAEFTQAKQDGRP